MSSTLSHKDGKRKVNAECVFDDLRTGLDWPVAILCQYLELNTALLASASVGLSTIYS